MIPRKLVETVFRNRLALVVPVILVPVLVVVLTSRPPAYRAHTLVWVSVPADSDAAFGHQNPYLTAAQNQATALNDLLRVETFRLAVVDRALLAGASPSDESKSAAAASLKAWGFAAGVNLLQIEAQASDPVLASRIVTAVVDEYRVRSREESQRDLEATAEYYRQQLSIAREELWTRQKRLTDYIAAKPGVADPRVAAVDPQYQSLQLDTDAESRLVQDLAAKLQDAELRLSARPGVQQAAFSVMDSAKPPPFAVSEPATRRYGLPLASVVFGLLLSATLLFVKYRADHTIVSVEDLAAVPVPVLGTIPELTPPGLRSRIPVLRTLTSHQRRGFARATARSIGSHSVEEGTRWASAVK